MKDFLKALHDYPEEARGLGCLLFVIVLIVSMAYSDRKN